MTNLQTIKSLAKSCNLTFKPNGSKINGAKLYDFANEMGTVVASNWTIASAIQEYYHGDLLGKIR